MEGPDSFEITYTRQAGKRPKGPRVYYRVCGDFGPDWEIPNNDVTTVKHAIMERVFFVKLDGNFQRAPKPWTTPAVLHHPDVTKIRDEKARYRKQVMIGRRIVRSKLQTAVEQMQHLAGATGQKDPLSVDEFVNCYVGAKRKVYSAAAESFSSKAFNLWVDSMVKSFTKDEYSKGTPRIIQPRTPRFNVMLGRWIKHLEHDIYEDLNRLFDVSGEHITVQKGRTHIERGNAIHKAWTEFDKPVCIELDAARFDQHLNTELLQIANEITMMYSTQTGPSDLHNLKQLLEAQLHNRGRFYGHEGKIKYSVEGCGMSGDMNTSLRNVIVMCIATFQFMEQLGCPYRYGNDGDDGWLIVEARDVDRVINVVDGWFIDIGLTMKVEGIKYHLEDIEFCQGKPVFNEDHGYVLIPKPQKRLYSDLVSTRDLSSKKIFNKWMGAVAGCGLAQTVGVPVMQNHYRWIAKAATPWVPQEGSIYYRHSWWNADNLPQGKRVFREPSIRERVSFNEAFGITPDAQRCLESYYDARPSARWENPVSDLLPTLPNLFRAFVVPVQADRLTVHTNRQ